MKFLLVTFLSIALAIGPKAAVAQVVQGGAWPDGATLEWVCGNKKLEVPFRFTLPDGKIYQGILTCGTSV